MADAPIVLLLAIPTVERINAIYAMDVVAKSYGVAFSETLIKQLYDELEKHINQMTQS